MKRIRDTDDRRKVLVELVPDQAAKLARLYEGLGAKMEKLASQYTVTELQLIEGLLDANLKILNQEIAALEQPR